MQKFKIFTQRELGAKSKADLKTMLELVQLSDAPIEVKEKNIDETE